MPRIRRALLSVSNKEHLVPLAKKLHRLNIQIISTGGTAKLLLENKISVQEVSDVTGFPEMLVGRVKTLHPKIHAGILAQDFQKKEIQNLGIEPIDLVVVNLYPFEETVQNPNVTLEDAIENIDIGGVALIRAAAKNFKRVTVVVDQKDYELLMQELTVNDAHISDATRRHLATKAFSKTAFYDAVVSKFFSDAPFSKVKVEALTCAEVLRYGENPHERASFYTSCGNKGIEQIHGKQLSFNNYMDIHSSLTTVAEFEKPACVVVKHANPCGVGVDGESLQSAWKRAQACDPVSYFGSIVAFNRVIEKDVAQQLMGDFVEVIVAPDFSSQAFEVFSTKKNLRVVKLLQPLPAKLPVFYEYRQVLNGYLFQEKNWNAPEERRIVTKRQPTEEELKQLEFAWKVVKHVKSNAIVVSSYQQTLGIGAGQMNRLDSVKIALEKAASVIATASSISRNDTLRGLALASDAFFPFRDSIDLLKGSGVTCVIQPGGSIRDTEVIQACDELGIAMVFTGARYFLH
ncbi:MAG: bifunctional phosphoribosylaminoimidazolecarboxamide formyltransferase/IMP cyclohydrolase [Deltaproteobacteria bacterium]|nr:bifunctional phosphoribosylaminoimidazolecarboxamide formyltransferase/IMP cyclohydrolase [Deltaproteobacteria bacterium]